MHRKQTRFLWLKLWFLERKELKLLAEEVKVKAPKVSVRAFKKAVKRARTRATITRRQIHVIPLPDGKLVIVDNEYMKIYNRTAKRKLNAFEFKQLALYSTQWTTKRRSKGN